MGSLLGNILDNICYLPFRPFEKITPINGFDENDPDNARQNNYAWAMNELAEYLYVGTGRNVLITMMNAMSERFGINWDIPPELQPRNIDMNAEIWRYKKDGSEKWQKVFKAPDGVFGFRYMVNYTTPDGETALYASAYKALGGSANLEIFKSTDGENWREIPNDIPGNSSRAMIIHNNRLYMTVVDESGADPSTKVYVSTDPEKHGWERVIPPGGDPAKNPTGQGLSMISFNGHLYLATGGADGFELWRTLGSEPEQDSWKLVVDKGAGDAANRAILTLGTFNNELYLATISLVLSPSAADSSLGLLSLMKPFDLIQVDQGDRWRLVMGSDPIDPTDPTTGKRGEPISSLPAGAGNLTNAYAWQLKQYGNYLYLGSFDWLVIFFSLARDMLSDPNLSQLSFTKNLLPYFIALIKRLARSNYDFTRLSTGFDLYRSRDGVRWEKISLDGFGNGHNYGIRTIFESENGHLYIGTANPYDGCEVWVSRI